MNRPSPPWLTLAFLVVLLGLLAAGQPAAAAPIRGRWPLAEPSVINPFNPPPQRWQAGHRGIDLAARPGDHVLAAAGGRVVFAGRVAGKPVITIDHGGGITTTYEPVEARVRMGQRVDPGQTIGTVGTGSHCPQGCLHWGLRHGKTYLDPLSMLGGDSAGGALRLVPAARRAVVQREAAARAAVEAAAEAAASAYGVVDSRAGSAGSHGFLHPVPGAVTSSFGRRLHPVLRVWKLHDGTDFGAGCGTPIRAAYGGRVMRVYSARGYGNRLLIDHGRVDGQHVITAYNHASGYRVRAGTRVRRGQVIGSVGSTGYSTGCHLHLMVWLNGRLVDPMTWL